VRGAANQTLPAQGCRWAARLGAGALYCAKIYELGFEKEAITRAHNAIQSPLFYEQPGQAPAVLVQA